MDAFWSDYKEEKMKEGVELQDITQTECFIIIPYWQHYPS